MPATSLPEHVQSEIEVFQAEARGQIYFHLSTVLFKMAQEVNASLFRALQFPIRYLDNCSYSIFTMPFCLIDLLQIVSSP